MSVLRIALLTYSTRPRGGVVATLSLAEALARASHDIDVWTLARGGDAGFFRPVDRAVGVVAVPFPDVVGESVGDRVLRSIDVLGAEFDRRAPERGYDVVHAQDCISANAVRSCIRTVHHFDTFTTPALVTCHERAIRRPYAHICVSRAVAAELAAGWGVTATVIPNGVDGARFAAAAGPDAAATAARSAWRARLGRYVLAVGGVEPRKGTAELVESFALLHARHPDVSLVIAGGETLFDYRDYRDAVFARAADLGVELTVLGTVGHDELPSLVAAASVFAFPSTREGFGLAAMEALAAGVPLVANDLPVLREVFAGAARFAAGVLAFADTLADALTDTAGDGAAHRAAHRAAGVALAARHSWDTAADAHVRFYRAIEHPVSAGTSPPV
jgi:glycosyltransferase-like protein